MILFINSFQQFIKDDELPASQKIKQRFSKLKENIAGFYQRWHDAAEVEKGNIDQRSSQLNKDIAKLVTDIDAYVTVLIYSRSSLHLFGNSALADVTLNSAL
jgi:hypothetical protein